MKNSRDFVVSLVMFAAFLNAIPLRIRQPYEKFNFHINSSDGDYSFMGKKKNMNKFWKKYKERLFIFHFKTHDF